MAGSSFTRIRGTMPRHSHRPCLNQFACLEKAFHSVSSPFLPRVPCTLGSHGWKGGPIGLRLGSGILHDPPLHPLEPNLLRFPPPFAFPLAPPWPHSSLLSNVFLMCVLPFRLCSSLFVPVPWSWPFLVPGSLAPFCCPVPCPISPVFACCRLARALAHHMSHARRHLSRLLAMARDAGGAARDAKGARDAARRCRQGF